MAPFEAPSAPVPPVQGRVNSFDSSSASSKYRRPQSVRPQRALSDISEMSTSSLTPTVGAKSELRTAEPALRARPPVAPLDLTSSATRTRQPARAAQPKPPRNPSSPYFSPGPYSSDEAFYDSEPDFRWSSSEISTSTQATSVYPEDTTTKSLQRTTNPDQSSFEHPKSQQQVPQQGRIGITLPDGRGRSFYVSVAPGNKEHSESSSHLGNEDALSGLPQRSQSQPPEDAVLMQHIQSLTEEVRSLQGSRSNSSKSPTTSPVRFPSFQPSSIRSGSARGGFQEPQGPLARQTPGDVAPQQTVQYRDFNNGSHERRQELSSSHKELNDLQQANTSLRQRNSDLERDLKLFKDYKACLEAKCDNLQIAIKTEQDRFLDEISKLQDDITDVESLRRAQDAAHIQTIVSLELSKEALQAKIEALEAANARSGAEFGELIVQRDQLVGDKEGLLAERGEHLKAREAWESERETLCSQISVISSDKDDSRQQTAALREVASNLETERTNLQVYVMELENGSSDLVSQVSTLTRDKRSLSRHIEDLESGTAEIKTKLEHLSRENADLRLHVSDLLATRQDQNSKLLSLFAERDGLKTETASLRSQLEAGRAVESVASSVVSTRLAGEGSSSKLPSGHRSTISKREASKPPNSSSSRIPKISKSSGGKTHHVASSRPGSRQSSRASSRAASRTRPSCETTCQDVVKKSSTEKAVGEKVVDDKANISETTPGSPSAAQISSPLLYSSSAEQVEPVPRNEPALDPEASHQAGNKTDGQHMKSEAGAGCHVSAEPVTSTSDKPAIGNVAVIVVETRKAPEDIESAANTANEPKGPEVAEPAANDADNAISIDACTHHESAPQQVLIQHQASPIVEMPAGEREKPASPSQPAQQDAAAQVPALCEDNGWCAAQLPKATAQSPQFRPVNDGASDVTSLKSRLSSPSRRSRSGSVRPSSKKGGDDKNQMVVVRDRIEKGKIRVMRRCDLKSHTRSASQSEGSAAE